MKIDKHFKPTRKLEELQDKMAETNFVTLKGKKISNNLAHVEYTVPFSTDRWSMVFNATFNNISVIS